jgi:sugar lactone lactonase YvrE
MADPEIVCVQDARALVAEGPVWSVAEQVLWWINMGGEDQGPSLNRFNPATEEAKTWPMQEQLGSVALADDGRVLIARRSGFYLFDPATARESLVAPTPCDLSVCEFNDGRCDAAGRFWVGTRFPRGGPPVPPGTGTLYSLERGQVRRHDLGPVTLHNGTGFSPDGRRLYTTETFDGVIYVSDFDLARGEVSNRRVFAKLEKGGADGAAVDSQGGYWNANILCGRIIRFLPDGSIDRIMPVPVTHPTMVAFGGRDLDELYISTAKRRLDAAGRAREPQAGGIFRCRVDVRGQEEPLYKV